jgi:acyl-CoA hydrolase
MTDTYSPDGNQHHQHPRPVKDSQSEMAEVVLPNDANPLGNLVGHRHSRSYVVTASMDHIDFLSPVHIGDLLFCALR